MCERRETEVDRVRENKGKWNHEGRERKREREREEKEYERAIEKEIK